MLAVRWFGRLLADWNVCPVSIGMDSIDRCKCVKRYVQERKDF